MIFCQQCDVEINPKYKAAIQNNSCPNCQGEILSPQSRQLMIEIKEALQKMPNDPEGLAGWLLSNYHLQKIDPEKGVEPEKFYYSKQKQTKQKSGNLNKKQQLQQLYNQDFDPVIDEIDEERNDTDPSDNPFFEKAGVTRSAAAAQALLQKAKQAQNEEWDPKILQAIAKMKPEMMNSLPEESDNDFSTIENYPIAPRTNTLPAPKSPEEVIMRNNNSRGNFAANGRSFKF